VCCDREKAPTAIGAVALAHISGDLDSKTAWVTANADTQAAGTNILYGRSRLYHLAQVD